MIQMKPTIRQSALSYIKSRPDSVLDTWERIFIDDKDPLIYAFILIRSDRESYIDDDAAIFELAYVMKEGDE